MQAAVEFQHISKRFGAVQANRDVSFSIAPGSIHGIIGENGAGKSTLMSILYGYYRADGGQLLINGTPQQIRNSQEAIDLGIGMVHQHFMLVENMTVLDNVMLGSEGGFRLAAHRKQVEASLREICQRYSLDVDPLAKIQDLSVGIQQRVEILKQIYRSANILILDEPTAVLTVQETASLFAVLRLFKEQGKTIILITHKLQEILDITDEVTVMRAGTVVGSVQTANTNKEQLAELMVGRPIETHLPRAPYAPGETVLDVKGLNLINAQQVSLLKDLNFNIRAGEIVAIAGVSGNGQSELLEVLSGMRLPSSGAVMMQGKPLPFAGRKDADGLPATFRELGIAHVPEDRLRDAVVKNFSVMMNSFLGYQKKLGKAFGLLDYKAILKTCNELLNKFDVRPADPHLRIALLSGGNQQKVVMAREMASEPKLMLVGQPTRGVDIGTIESLHARLLAMRDAGVAILLVSVELEEVRALADRILVMSGGCITGELKVEEFDATRIGLLMGGLHKH
ncbi:MULTISPECIES: ABC transporter ATP-binding protein [unclassified Undibacterium]|uniref:ABC transporter ATP-binding protein n=1 Tax=unclassified Undibacterium TaxID=2630295 RepID=UPI00164ADD04|nr:MULTISPECIES: ABC transporter ATP-binding protein [unclassified Undibacterium]MBC3878270.1 ABC transporter ATP-binding protein [Undibacterium sp. FT79W]MBC3927273.1 ABC transporter ATP-binding protein [Undibacterium sp. CY21W]